MRHLSRMVPIAAIAFLLTAGAAPAIAADALSVSVVPAVRNASPAPSDDSTSMPGMDMPADKAPADAPEQDMPGMDMPAKDMPATVDEHAGSTPRPRGLLLGTFAAVNAAVLLGALVVRRRTRAERDRKHTTRATAPSTP